MIFSSPPEQLAADFAFLEGPVWCPPESAAARVAGLTRGGLLFSDLERDRIHWWQDARVGVFREPSEAANGNTLDCEGRLVTCEHATRRVTRTGRDGVPEVLAGRWRGSRLNSPNDITSGSNGWLYFTDPPYGVQHDERELPVQGVFRLDGAAGTVDLEVDDFEKPNGLALSPDQATLYVADTARGHLRAFDVAADGHLSGGRLFCEVARPDGVRVDVHGRLYVAALTGVTVFGPGGETVATLELPERPANLTFGEDGRSLFICARTGLYRVRTREPGFRLAA
ncbi:MAG: SMP-30/gluconolactonase/LRE family protein [Gammaproteobacteria bacterium]